MRIKITFDFPDSLKLPYRHFEDLQKLVYELLADYADVGWLHNEGVEYNKRKYKPLVYSHLIGKRQALKNNWEYYPEVSLYISSPLPAIIEAIEKRIKQKAYYRFCGKTFVIAKYELLDSEIVNSKTIRTLSPIVCSTPILLTNGKIFQKYVNAFEYDFSRIIQENLQNKAKAFYNLNLNGKFEIKPLFDFNSQKNYNHLFYYKTSVIKGWNGKFEITGSSDYIYVAQNCGIGSKNAQGFGMIETV